MKSKLPVASFKHTSSIIKNLLTLIFLISSFQLMAQTRPTTSQPIPLRQVSGIVKDSTDQGVIGAAVTLTSSADTINTVTNEDGIFIFKNVKSWIFSIKVSSLGYGAKVIAGKYNDATPKLTLDPIVIKEEHNLLNEVVVNGTPSIVYKTDTVEYRASDYVVRKGATVDELLQKMEGMEVGNDGSVTVNGTAITKARINGKDIYGGDVATAVQNLPAEIVDRIQVVDDYGNTAKRTGIKEGDPTKVLNITTRTDKSVGNMARLNGGVGTIDQFEGSANLTRINGNQTLTFNGTFMKTPNGIAGGNSSVGRLGGAQNRGGRSGGFGGGGGNSASGGANLRALPAFTYRDKFGEKVEFLANYSYRYTDNNSIINSNSQTFSTLGTTVGNRYSNGDNISKAHNIKFEIEYNIDSANYLQITPEFSSNNSGTGNFSQNYQTGLINQDQINNSTTDNSTPDLKLTLAYQHVWLKNTARSFAVEATIGQQKNDNGSIQNNNILYRDSNDPTIILKDSIIHRGITTDNTQKNYRLSVTYAEPLSTLSRMEFNANVERRGYDNSRLTSNLDNSNNPTLIDSLSNIFDYFFTQYRNSVNYKYGNNNSKYSFSLGATAVSTSLVGQKVSLGTTTDQSYFKLIPIARFQLRLSNTHRLTLYYNGRANEPNFNQIQPVRDVSNPQNPIVGNPNLKVAFSHAIIGQYSNYIANSKLNYSLRGSTSFTENQVSNNTVQIKDAYGSLKNETRYVNLNGNRSNSIDYSISKQLSDRKYNLSFNGNVDNSHRVSMSNDELNTATTWGFKESLGPRITPNNWLDINPYISYDVTKTDYSLPRSTDINQKIWALSVDGNFYFLKSMQFGYAVSKNFVSGIGNNVTNNPLIINTMLQMKVFKNKGSLQLRAYDLLNQNNFINRNQNENGFTEILSNPNSRYVMLNLSMNLQKWSGAIGKNGQGIRRRGDGSFMN
ncbi:MAG: outer membrane beta-barrel protein [Pelobium sp.]